MKLSNELMEIKRYNDSHKKALKSVLRKGAVGRIKTVPSTLRKLRQRYIRRLGDVAGATFATRDRKAAYAARRRLRKRFKYMKGRSDDYYKHPKDGAYYSLHDTYNIGGRKIEVQFKSRKMKKFAAKMHTAYKTGQSVDKYRQAGRSLFDLGY